MTHKLTDAEKRRNFLFRVIDNKAMTGLNRDLKKARIIKDPGEYTRGGSVQYDKPKVFED